MTLHPCHAWTLARLVAGQAVNGELQALPEPYLPIAGRLAGLPPEAHDPAWQGFLDGRDDRAEIVTALAHVDPEGPPPEALTVEDEPGDAWGPIRLGSIPPADPFPLDVLPIPARDLAEAAARSIGCPVDFPAAATLAVASGAIGRSARIRAKPRYFESASLFLALIGASSDGKSPSIKEVAGPLRAIDARLRADYREALAAWDQAPEESRGVPPALRRIITTSPTVEALLAILARNPRGVILLPHEFVGFVLSMGQYKGGRGADRQIYLSAWGGDPIAPDRAKDAENPTFVEHPFLTILGGLTPGKLPELARDGGDEDGFMARLLFAFPEPVSRRVHTDEGIDDEIADAWDGLIGALWGRSLPEAGGATIPSVASMDQEARRLWGTWWQAHYDEQTAEGFPHSLRGPWGKLQAYYARLPLTLHLMHLAADPTAPADGPIPDIPRRIVEDAARLVAYFNAHARRVYAAMRGKGAIGGDDVQAILRWIALGDRIGFSIKNIKDNFNRF